MGQETSRSPGYVETLRAAVDNRLLDVHTSMPGRVERFDPDTQTVDVQPLIQRLTALRDGSEAAEVITVIPRVPYQFPRAGKFRITWPVQKGDLVELIFTEVSRDNYQAGDGSIVSPDDFRRFNLSDAYAVPGAYPESKALNNFDTNDMVLGFEDGCEIHINPDEINLGSKAAADFVALATKVQTELTNLKTAITGTTVVAQDGGASFKATLLTALSSFPGSVAASKVKAD